MPKKFIYKINNQNAFSCILNSTQCTATSNTSGNRCKRKCIIGFEYCPIHLLYLKHLKIKDSLIPNSGKGLFVCNKSVGPNDIVFRKDDVICDYKGETINNAIRQQRYNGKNAPYAIELSNNNIIDCACKRGIGSLINTSPGHNNASFSINNQQHTVRIKATKNIRNNTEIYLSYGSSYRFNDGSTHITKNYYPS